MEDDVKTVVLESLEKGSVPFSEAFLGILLGARK
jgi:hypothetical protein